MNVPASHSEHVADPTALNVPASQSEQVADPAALNVPASHSEQVADPARLNVPAPHPEHWIFRPFSWLKVPGRHSLHLSVVVSVLVTGVQSERWYRNVTCRICVRKIIKKLKSSSFHLGSDDVCEIKLI